MNRVTPRKAVPVQLIAAAAALVIAIPAGVMAWAVYTGNVPVSSASANALSIVSPGMDAPDFTLPTQDGRTMHLADYRGRAVFLAFVPDWTDADTATQVRALAKTEGDFDMAGAKVMVVSSDSPDSARELHDKAKLPFPLLHDANGALAKQFGVAPGIRRTFVISPVGQVKYRVDNAAMDIAHHGQQLLDISKCCVDEIVAARADGIGKPVGDYSLPRANDGDAAMTTLYGDGSQKATVALFLSAKCPCSNAYNDRVRELAEEYTAKGVRFVGIYANADETREEITAHAKEHGFTFPVLKDDRSLCATHFGAGVTPESYLIDGERVLRYAGRIDDDRDPKLAKHHDLRDAVGAILAGKTPPAATRSFGCAIVKNP